MKWISCPGSERDALRSSCGDTADLQSTAHKIGDCEVGGGTKRRVEEESLRMRRSEVGQVKRKKVRP